MWNNHHRRVDYKLASCLHVPSTKKDNNNSQENACACVCVCVNNLYCVLIFTDNIWILRNIWWFNYIDYFFIWKRTLCYFANYVIISAFASYCDEQLSKVTYSQQYKFRLSICCEKVSISRQACERGYSAWKGSNKKAVFFQHALSRVFRRDFYTKFERNLFFCTRYLCDLY